MNRIYTLRTFFIFILLFQQFVTFGFEHSNQKVKVDTNRVFYYSFLLDKAVEYNPISAENTKIEVCKGEKLLLEAPNSASHKYYLWEGPNGFRSYQPNIYFEQINSSQAGLYSISEISEETKVSGIIEVIIKSEPEYSYQIESSKDFVKINLDENSFGTSYVWKDAENNILGKGCEIIVPRKKESIQILADNNGCVTKKTIKLR